jgi:hypothetical protein
LAGWTLYVWANRIVNIASDDDLGTGSRVAGVALASSFVVLAGMVLAAWWRRAPLAAPVAALALWTVVVWVPRAVLLFGSDHSGAFKAVHLALAATSMVLAALAWRRVSRPAAVRPRSRAPSR